MNTQIPSWEKLAHALHAAGLFDLERRARNKEFSDYDGPHALPQLELINELSRWYYRREVRSLIARVKAGDFDATRQESDDWWEREGKYLCPPSLRHIFERPS